MTDVQPLQALYIKTYGCQTNVYDSQKMAELLLPLGYGLTEDPAEASLVILNTCHVREKATEKVYSDLGRMRMHQKRRLDETGDSMRIIVAGCVGQAEGEAIFERAPFVDAVVGPQSYQHLPELLGRLDRGQRHVTALEFEADQKFDSLPESVLPQGASAFVAVQEGCDKFCHFCSVSYTRGAEYSRPVPSVMREVLLLASRGVREITLLGQNVNAYHGEGVDSEEGAWDLGRLLHRVAEVPGVTRLRYTTSHPRDMHESLYRAHAELGVVMPFVHLPVQSGSDRVLKAMNRKHGVREYMEVIDRLRRERSGMAFSSDFIVGYPGETEQDFLETLALVKEVGYAQAYSFKYSPRPGTPASGLVDQVPEPVKVERLARLQEALQWWQRRFNRQSVGGEVEVLFDRPGKHPGQWMGRTQHMQSCYVASEVPLLGQCLRVRVTEATLNSISGVLAEEDVRSLVSAS